MTESRTDGAPCVVDVAGGGSSPVVLVSFAGWAGGHAGVSAPEFSRTVEGLPADVVFLRDPYDCAYLDGVPGAGGSIAEVAAWLRGLCARKGARRVVTMGNSTGGWAAILFGILIGADDVQAFAPKTRMCGTEDFHEPDRFPRVAQSIRGDGDLLDLREVLARQGTAKTRISIHYPRHDPVDARHARHFEGLPGVRLFEYRFQQHTLARALRDAGVLRPILANAIAGNDAGVRLTALRGRLLLRQRRFREALLRPLWRVVTSPF